MELSYSIFPVPSRFFRPEVLRIWFQIPYSNVLKNIGIRNSTVLRQERGVYKAIPQLRLGTSFVIRNCVFLSEHALIITCGELIELSLDYTRVFNSKIARSQKNIFASIGK